MTDTSETSRKRRTPAEIAQDELKKADERVTKSDERVAKAREELDKAHAEQNRAVRFREYAAANPDLPGADLGDVTGQMTRNDGGQFQDPDEPESEVLKPWMESDPMSVDRTPSDPDEPEVLVSRPTPHKRASV